MAKNQIFQPRRDGRVSVRLNDVGRQLVRSYAQSVIDAETETSHEWHPQLHTPIDPSRDADDPLAVLAEQRATATNAELVVLTVDEETLTKEEVWAWLTTLQVALRSVSLAKGLLSDEALEKTDLDTLNDVRTLQQLLFELAECLS